MIVRVFYNFNEYMEKMRKVKKRCIKLRGSNFEIIGFRNVI